MELSGLRVHVTVGNREISRVPRVLIKSIRHANLTHMSLMLPDPAGDLLGSVPQGESVTIKINYRDQVPAFFKGTVRTKFRSSNQKDQLVLGLVGEDRPLSKAVVCQAFENEDPAAIVRWAIAQAGLQVGRIDSPGVLLRHFIAASVPVWQVARQAAHSAQKAFDLDMSRWALWLGKDGVNWGDFDEPGDVPVLTTGAGIIDHQPGEDTKGLSMVETFLLPELTHSRLVRINDTRRSTDQTVRALQVWHIIMPDKARTLIFYGEEYGRY